MIKFYLLIGAVGFKVAERKYSLIVLGESQIQCKIKEYDHYRRLDILRQCSLHS